MAKSIITMKIEGWIGIAIIVFIVVSLGMFVFTKVSELNNLVEMNRSELYEEEIMRLRLRD